MNTKSRTQQRLDDLHAKVRWLRTFPVVKKIILFGSCARGEERPDSDVDLAVILECAQEDVQTIEQSIRKQAFLSETPFDFVYMSAEYFSGKAKVKGSLAFYIDQEGIDVTSATS